MSFSRIALAVTASMCSASLLAAQTAEELCRNTFAKLTTGQWAEYRVVGRAAQGGGPSTMRIAIVGAEQTGNATLYRIEFNLTGPMGPMVVQVLVPGYPYEQAEVQEIIVKMGDQPAMKMPTQMLGMGGGMGGGEPGGAGLNYARKCGDAELVGWEQVTVPAGTMRAAHLKATDGGDAWVTDRVPFGVARWTDPQGGEVTLLSHGTDARSSITEKPQDMPMGRRPPGLE